MIQLIIDYKNDEAFIGVLESVNEEGIKLYSYNYIKVPEMNDAWIVLCKPEQVTDLEDALKLPPLKINIIGTYNMDGTQYIWTEPQTIQRNHNINKYKTNLKNVIDYNDEGNETGSHPPTEVEALDTQVNKIYGYTNDRILTDPI